MAGSSRILTRFQTFHVVIQQGGSIGDAFFVGGQVHRILASVSVDIMQQVEFRSEPWSAERV